MKLSVDGCIRRSVYLAFAAGIAAVAAPALAQETAPPTGAAVDTTVKVDEKADEKAAAAVDATVKVDEKPDEKATESAVKLEAVKVTGTRITVPGATSSSPIVTLRAEEFSLQQTPEVEQVLRNLPSTLPSDGSNVNNGTAGAATINLRGLGSNRTLVLIDGKRLTPYDINGLVDTSIIPTALMERVDLITGGASAVYGSDALAGAINVMMKRNFEGVDVTYRNGFTEEGDGDKSSLAIAMGSNVAGGKGNVSMALTYAHRDGVQLGQRPLGQLGIVTATGAGLQQYLAGQPPTAAPAGCGGPGSVAAGGSTTTLPTRIAILGIANPAAGFQFREDGSLQGNCSVFNFNPFNYYETPQDRYGGAVFGRFTFNDHAEVYSRFLYSNTTVRQQVAPSGVFGNSFFTPLANPFISDQALAAITSHANANRSLLNTPTINNWRDVNGNGTVDEPDYLSISYRRRTVEFDERSTTFDNNAYQAVIGLRGAVFSSPALGDWEYDVSLQRGQSQSNRVNAGYSSLTNIGNALDSVNGVTCANRDPNCVPINLFGGFGSITPAMARYASATALEARTYTQYVTTAVLSGSVDIHGPFADRPLGVSLGVERRREQGTTTPDECLKLAPTSCLGGAGGNILPISGGFHVNELFTEAVVPLVDGKFLAKALDLNLAYRWSDYNPSGLNKTWKYGLSWEPVDGLLARVEHQRAARAPNVGELAAPQTTGLANALFDPCSVGNPDAASPSPELVRLCEMTGVPKDQTGKVEDVVSGQINGFFGTDLNALPGPERGDTTTIGVVWQPRFIPFIRNAFLSLDYYDIKVTDYIGSFGAQEVLDSCYQGVNVSECAKVRRVGGSLVNPGSGLELFTTNLKYLQAEGLELVSSFDVKAGNFGKVKLSLDANYYFSQESQSSSLSNIIDCRGAYGNQCGNPLPTFRSIQRTTWSFKDFDVSYFWRYIGSAKVESAQIAETFEPFESIGGTSYFDASVGYTFRKNYRISALATNILERDPPVVGNEAATTAANSGNTFPSVYDALGRTYSVSISAKF